MHYDEFAAFQFTGPTSYEQLYPLETRQLNRHTDLPSQSDRRGTIQPINAAAGQMKIESNCQFSDLATAGMTGNLATAGYWEFDRGMALGIWPQVAQRGI